MPRTATLAAIRNDARALCDAEGDPNVTDAQILVWVNLDIQALWNRLLVADPDRCTQSTTISTTAGTSSYTLPADFLSIRAVDLHSGNDRIPIHQWIQQERWNHRNASTYLTELAGASPVHFRIMGQGIAGADARIHFLPDPGTNTYDVRYIEVAPTVANDNDTVDGIAGFEHWISLRCARRICKKQNRYEGEFESDIAELETQIDTIAHNRNAAEAPRIANVRSPRLLFPAAR
jgi:hypothetical protein